MKSFTGLLWMFALAALPAFAEIKRDIEYGRAGGERLLLDVHVPDGPGPFPIAILVHGGGMKRGDKSGSDRPGDGADISPWFKPLSAASFTWFSINYRLLSDHLWPAPLEDVFTAIRWVKAHAAVFKGDPTRIALFGHSAGGNLAAHAVTNATNATRVQAAVLFAPGVGRDESDIPNRDNRMPVLQNLLHPPKGLTPEILAILRNSWPIYHVNARMAPVLIVHGEEDRVIPYEQSLDFQATLQAAGVPCEVIIVKGGPHSIITMTEIDPGYQPRMIAWLHRAFGDAHRAPLVRPDLVVAADGSGDFRTVQAALDSIPRGNRERRIVLLKEGIYSETIRIESSCVTLRGESRRSTRIEYAPENGTGVVNIAADDCVLENLSIQNTRVHRSRAAAVAVAGRGDRTVIVDCDVFSEGANTFALRNPRGRSYSIRVNMRGADDAISPQGASHIANSSIYAVNPERLPAGQVIGRPGGVAGSQRLVLQNCRFDGAQDWRLRHPDDEGELFLLGCTFSRTMFRGDSKGAWARPAYFHNTRHRGGNYPWHADNLADAPNAPSPTQITAKWTFGGTWDPERREGPSIVRVERRRETAAIRFAETVTVKGAPKLSFSSGAKADYFAGSGSDTLLFSIPPGDLGDAIALDCDGGAILASEAGVVLRVLSGVLPLAR